LKFVDSIGKRLRVLLVVFLWGPQRHPEIARSIGEAKKEFQKAAKMEEGK
jgi:Sec-independent protein translocase protein TatA